jgi:hypothetical protein
MSLILVAVGKAVVDGWAEEAPRAMPLDVGKRLVEFLDICLNVNINLQSIGEVVVNFDTLKS